MTEPFGRRETHDGTAHLVLDVELAHPREVVWRTLATSQGLEPWLGTFEGDPASGTVTFRMTAEGADAPAEPVEIHRCSAPNAFDVSISMAADAWRLGVTIDETPTGSRVTLAHRVDDPAGIDLVGPGWEYYLHRLRAHLDGDDFATIDFNDYLPNSAFYADLFGVEPSGPPAGYGG